MMRNFFEAAVVAPCVSQSERHSFAFATSPVTESVMGVGQAWARLRDLRPMTIGAPAVLAYGADTVQATPQGFLPVSTG